MMTGISGSCFLMKRRRSRPDMPGIIMSLMTSENDSRLTRFSASKGLRAGTTLQVSVASCRARMLRTCSSSSTTRMVALGRLIMRIGGGASCRPHDTDLAAFDLANDVVVLLAHQLEHQAAVGLGPEGRRILGARREDDVPTREYLGGDRAGRAAEVLRLNVELAPHEVQVVVQPHDRGGRRRLLPGDLLGCFRVGGRVQQAKDGLPDL